MDFNIFLVIFVVIVVLIVLYSVIRVLLLRGKRRMFHGTPRPTDDIYIERHGGSNMQGINNPALTTSTTDVSTVQSGNQQQPPVPNYHDPPPSYEDLDPPPPYSNFM